MRLYIVGSVASGKTTLAKKLSQKLNIPYYELDKIVHQKTDNGRYKRTPEEQVEVIKGIDCCTSGWIIEGTYRKSCHLLFELADVILFIDTPLWKRKYRIFSRFLKQQLGVEKCDNKSDLKMLSMMYKWTSDFEANRPEFIKMLSEYGSKLIVATDVNKEISKIIT